MLISSFFKQKKSLTRFFRWRGGTKKFLVFAFFKDCAFVFIFLKLHISDLYEWDISRPVVDYCRNDEELNKKHDKEHYKELVTEDDKKQDLFIKGDVRYIAISWPN